MRLIDEAEFLQAVKEIEEAHMTPEIRSLVLAWIRAHKTNLDRHQRWREAWKNAKAALKEALAKIEDVEGVIPRGAKK